MFVKEKSGIPSILRNLIHHFKTNSVNRLQLVLIVLCNTLFFAMSNAQNNESQIEAFSFFDKLTGIENSDLHYGEVYQEKHRVKSKKTKFFPEPDFVLGSVVFNGQPYFDIPLKYNIYDDELLMLTDKQFGGTILQLHKKQVNSFKIGNHFFIKIHNTEIANGFYEVALESPIFSLLKKHRKSLRQLLGENLVFYEFEDEEKDYFLRYQNTYHSIEKISDLISIFSKYETELKSFEEKQDSSLPLDSKLERLTEYLDTLLSGEHDKM